MITADKNRSDIQSNMMSAEKLKDMRLVRGIFIREKELLIKNNRLKVKGIIININMIRETFFIYDILTPQVNVLYKLDK